MSAELLKPAEKEALMHLINVFIDYNLSFNLVQKDGQFEFVLQPYVLRGFKASFTARVHLNHSISKEPQWKLYFSI